MLSIEVFAADFEGFDFVAKSLAAFDFVDIIRSLAAFDFAELFRTFFGVDVAFAAFDPDLGNLYQLVIFICELIKSCC